MCGDVDNNGIVNDQDVAAVYDYVTGVMPAPSQAWLDAAAVDHRTGVDYGDYLHLYRYVNMGTWAPCYGSSYGDTLFSQGVIMLGVSDILPGYGVKLPINTEITVTVNVWNTNIERNIFGFAVGLDLVSDNGLTVTVNNPTAYTAFGAPFADACLGVDVLADGNMFGVTGRFQCNPTDGIEYDGNYTVASFTIGPFGSEDVGKTFYIEQTEFGELGQNAYYAYSSSFVLPYAPIVFGLDRVFEIVDPALEPEWVCGDVNGDGTTNITDIVQFTNYVHVPGATLTQPQAADVDQYAGVDVGDLAYMWDYIFEGGPQPCEYDGLDQIGTGGFLQLDSAHGLIDPNTVATGEPVTFYIGVTNNTSGNFLMMAAGFSVTSPDGATIPDTVSVNIIGDLSDVHGFWPLAQTEQTWPDRFGCFSMTTQNGALPPDYTGGAWALTVGPFDAADVGKTIVLDNGVFGQAGSTRMFFDGHTPVVPGWGGPYSFTIGQRMYTPGDIDNSGRLDIADVVFMVTYMFQDGIAPAYISACDVNGDCADVDISDLIHMVDYFFNGGPELEFACAVSGAAKVRQGEVTLSSEFDGEQTIITMSSDVAIRGLQLDLVGGDQASARLLVNAGLDVLGGTGRGLYSLGLADLDGSEVIDAGTHEILTIPGECEIVDALACDEHRVTNQVTLAAKGAPVPEGFGLSQNYPNPFNPVTSIPFSLPQSSHVKLEVVNILGQSVEVLVNEVLDAGTHDVQFDGDGYASGIYFYRLSTDSFTQTRKMVLMK